MFSLPGKRGKKTSSNNMSGDKKAFQDAEWVFNETIWDWKSVSCKYIAVTQLAIESHWPWPCRSNEIDQQEQVI